MTGANHKLPQVTDGHRGSCCIVVGTGAAGPFLQTQCVLGQTSECSTRMFSHSMTLQDALCTQHFCNV